MDNPKRIETAARALARYRLGKETFVSSLNPDLVAKLRENAEDKLWRSLVGEATAVVEALDALRHDASDRVVEDERTAATPRNVAHNAAALGTVPTDGTIRVDQAAIANEPSRGLGEQRLGSTRTAEDRQPATMPPNPDPARDPATEALRSAIAALVATGLSRSKT